VDPGYRRCAWRVLQDCRRRTAVVSSSFRLVQNRAEVRRPEPRMICMRPSRPLGRALGLNFSFSVNITPRSGGGDAAMVCFTHATRAIESAGAPICPVLRSRSRTRPHRAGMRMRRANGRRLSHGAARGRVQYAAGARGRDLGCPRTGTHLSRVKTTVAAAATATTSWRTRERDEYEPPSGRTTGERAARGRSTVKRTSSCNNR